MPGTAATECASGAMAVLARSTRRRSAQRIRAALAACPEASLRDIARAVGASPETVRAVRAELLERPHEPPALDAPVNLAEWSAARERGTRWQPDHAFTSRDDGTATARFLERTDVRECDLARHASAIPLNRVYEVSDEARRRAEFWQQLAERVEARAHSKGPIEMNFETPDVSSECIIDLDHHSKEFNLDELATSADLRRRCPVAWNTRYGGFWMATSYAAVAQIARDVDTFAHKYELNADDGIDYYGEMGIPRSDALPPLGIGEVDGAYHVALRRVLNPFFTRQAVAQLRPFIQDCVTWFIDQKIEDGHMDLVLDLREPGARAGDDEDDGPALRRLGAVGRLLPLHDRLRGGDRRERPGGGPRPRDDGQAARLRRRAPGAAGGGPHQSPRAPGVRRRTA